MTRLLLASLFLAGALPTHAEPLAAPSTLPGAAAAPAAITVPAAPAQTWKPATAQQHATPTPVPATQNLPQAITGNAAVQHSPARALRQKSPTHAALTAIEESIQVQDPKQFAPLEIARLKRTLTARFGTLDLDDQDRAALKIDPASFQQLRGASSVTPATRHTRPDTLPHVMGLPGMGTDASHLTAKSAGSAKLALSPDHWCATYQQNRPRISRLLIDSGQLVPGMAFVLTGVCLGDRPGSVEVRFPGDNARTVQARVLDWSSNKIFAELPNITGVPPGTVDIIAVTADRRITAPRPQAFMPRWQLVDVPFPYSRVTVCAHTGSTPYVRSRCIAGKNDLPSFGYRQPSGLFEKTLFAPPANTLYVHRYTEKDIETSSWVNGEDRWMFELPPYAHLHSWQMSYERISDSQYTEVRTTWDAAQNRILAAWRMGDKGDAGFLRYRIFNIKAWLPVGMRLD